MPCLKRPGEPPKIPLSSSTARRVSLGSPSTCVFAFQALILGSGFNRRGRELTDAVMHQLLSLEIRLFFHEDPYTHRSLLNGPCPFCLQGDYVRLWVPELRGIEGAAAHTPWALSSAALSQAGVTLGETYPQPVVTAPEWSRHISQRPVSTGKVGTGRGGVFAALSLCRRGREFCSSFSGTKGNDCFSAKCRYLTAGDGPAPHRGCAARVI